MASKDSLAVDSREPERGLGPYKPRQTRGHQQAWTFLNKKSPERSSLWPKPVSWTPSFLRHEGVCPVLASGALTGVCFPSYETKAIMPATKCHHALLGQYR